MTAESKASPDKGVDPDAASVSDAAVIRLSLSDSERFAELFHRHAPRIQRYVARRHVRMRSPTSSRKPFFRRSASGQPTTRPAKTRCPGCTESPPT